MREPVPQDFKLFQNLPVANIYCHTASGTVLVVTTVNFVPMETFKTAFKKVYDAIEMHQVRQVVFDKRSLTIFHQPSMEWYYTEWKTKLYRERGIAVHGKILPKDDPFRQSVHSAREKVIQNKLIPELQQIKICYYENYQDMQEAGFYN